MKKSTYYTFIMLLLTSFGCDEFVQIDPPRTDLVRSTVFIDDVTAEAAMIDVYFSMKNGGFASGDPSSISLLKSLAADELNFYGTSNVEEYQQFNDNNIQANNILLYGLWNDLYTTIYKANAVLEGLAESNGVSVPMKNQLTGEAKFLRAFSYYYLANIWDNAPLVLTTDYKTNNQITSTTQEKIYNQIVDDLTSAQVLLADDFSFAKGQRTRVNKSAATAMLSRVYLFTGDWANAEKEASKVIDNSSVYYLEDDLSQVFLTSSYEAIFQIWSDQVPNDFVSFLVHPAIGPLFGSLHTNLVEAFEADDDRKSRWTEEVVYEGTTYHQPIKYQYSAPPTQYSTVLRLAELYLIRAEARAQQDKLSDASLDVNAIRTRAGLPDIDVITKAELLEAIMAERQMEFFCEWGHRWFDLKRVGLLDAVMTNLKPNWSESDAVYPIPEAQLVNNPNTAVVK